MLGLKVYIITTQLQLGTIFKKILYFYFLGVDYVVGLLHSAFCGLALMHTSVGLKYLHGQLTHDVDRLQSLPDNIA